MSFFFWTLIGDCFLIDVYISIAVHVAKVRVLEQ